MRFSLLQFALERLGPGRVLLPQLRHLFLTLRCAAGRAVRLPSAQLRACAWPRPAASAGSRRGRRRTACTAPRLTSQNSSQTSRSSARSWLTSITVPSNSFSAIDSASRVVRSRWLVGSSSSSRLGRCQTSIGQHQARLLAAGQRADRLRAPSRRRSGTGRGSRAAPARAPAGPTVARQPHHVLQRRVVRAAARPAPAARSSRSSGPCLR